MKKLRAAPAAVAGYTLVEVMLAVSVMTVGALGFTSMQGASSRAVRSAQETTLAVAWQETWVERVRRDALRWNSLGKSGLSTTEYLKESTDSWYVPKPGTAGESAAADFAGHDTTTSTNMRYCVNLKNVAVHLWNPATRPTVTDTDIDAMRVDVRVWWYRAAGGLDGTPLSVNMVHDGCTVPGEDDFKDRRLSKTVSSTVVRWRALQ